MNYYLKHNVTRWNIHHKHGYTRCQALLSTCPAHAASHINLGLVPSMVGLSDCQVEALLWWMVLVWFVVYTSIDIKLSHSLTSACSLVCHVTPNIWYVNLAHVRNANAINVKIMRLLT